MDHSASDGRDLESGGTGNEDETSKNLISGNKPAKHILGRLRSGLLGYAGSANGKSSASGDKLGASTEDPHDNIELMIDKNSGQSLEHVPLLEKNPPVKGKRKTSIRKAPKPPRPPKGPTLDVSDVKLVMEISELAMKKRARIQRNKALKKMNAELASLSSPPSSPPSPSSATSSSSIAAMLVTLLFFLIIVFQGIYSRHGSSASFQGSPEPATAVNGLISIQLYNSTPPS